MGTVGSWIGGVVGGVVGFFIGGGPAGAVIGFGFGFGLGLIVDPMTPDIPAQGAPNKEKIVSNIIGNPICDLLGTSKISGHFVCYGLEKTKKVSQSSGGKGGGGSSSGGETYRYYMSWVQAICFGPVDTLYTVYKDNDEIVWEGILNRPSDGSYETITLEGLGTMRFYFGTDDQPADSVIAAIINAGPGKPNPDEEEGGNIYEPVIDGDTLNSPMLGLCYAVFDNCSLGNYSRIPTIRFLLRKTPQLDFADGECISQFDYNPSHAIYYIMNEMTGLPDIWLNETQFSSVAEDLLLEERGISCLFDSHSTALSYIENILNHIDGIVRYNADATFSPFLLRNDYDVDSLELIDEDKMLDEPTFSRKSWIDTHNEIKIQYNQLCWKTDETTKKDQLVDYPGTTIVDHGVNSNILWAGSGQIGREGGNIVFGDTESDAGGFIDELGMGFCFCNAENTDTRDLAYIDKSSAEDVYAQAMITTPVSYGDPTFYAEMVLSKNNRCYDVSFELFIRANPENLNSRCKLIKEMGSDVLTLYGDETIVCDDYFVTNSIYRIEALENVLRAYCNGRQIGETTCEDFASGYSGMAVADNKKAYVTVSPAVPTIGWGGSCKFSVSYPTRSEEPTLSWAAINGGSITPGPDIDLGLSANEALYEAPANGCYGTKYTTIHVKCSVTWNNLRMQCDDIVTFSLPANAGPPQGLITYSTLQMSGGESQTFGIANMRAGAIYTWTCTGGEMDGSTFTASEAPEASCDTGSNASVTLYDCGIAADTINLSIDYGMGSFPEAVAFREAVGDWTQMYSCAQLLPYPTCTRVDCELVPDNPGFLIQYTSHFIEYYCDGSPILIWDDPKTDCTPGSAPYIWTEKQHCSGIGSLCCGSACSECYIKQLELEGRREEKLAECIENHGPWGDVRTEAMKAAGCCPSNLL